ncbi:TPA: hypothetical protein ACI4K3_001652 [Klebsiella pneumoniae]
MSKTRDNHYVPQWHQKGFMEEREQQLCHLTRREINIPGGETKLVESKKWQTPTQRFYEVDLYSTFFGSEINDDIERQLFGPIDNNGSTAIRAFLGDDQAKWHNSFVICLRTLTLRNYERLKVWIGLKANTLS